MLNIDSIIPDNLKPFLKTEFLAAAHIRVDTALKDWAVMEAHDDTMSFELRREFKKRDNGSLKIPTAAFNFWANSLVSRTCINLLERARREKYPFEGLTQFYEFKRKLSSEDQSRMLNELLIIAEESIQSILKQDYPNFALEKSMVIDVETHVLG